MPCVPDIWSLLTGRVRTSGAQPLVTYLDAASGERTELSATSVANAAAKIANALRDEYDLEPGDRVALDLPMHWQRSTWSAGVWTAGCIVTDSATDAELIVTTVDRATESPTPTVVVSMHPFGLPVSEPLPAGVTDATVAVRQQPDAWLYETPEASMPALEVSGRTLSQDELLAEARALGCSTGDRVLAADIPSPLTSLLAGLPLPLAIDGSVVLVAGSDAPASIRDQERVTATLVG